MFFLRYDEKTTDWVSIPANKIPIELTQANLSESYDGWMNKERYGVLQTHQQILGRNGNREQGSSRFFSRKIPLNFEDWKYKLKNRFKNERVKNDCRPPIPLPVDAINPISPIPPSRTVKLEVLNLQEHEPLLTFNSTQWSTRVWDTNRNLACKSFLKPADTDNPQLDSWMVFINDTTGKKLTSNRNSNRICEGEFIWFIDYVAEKGKVVIIKANKIGDIIYRVSFDRPSEIYGYSDSIMMPEFKSENGYISFDWQSATSSGQEWKVKRNMKVRFLEPSK